MKVESSYTSSSRSIPRVHSMREKQRRTALFCRRRGVNDLRSRIWPRSRSSASLATASVYRSQRFINLFTFLGPAWRRKRARNLNFFGEWFVLFFFIEKGATYSFVILAIFEPSSHSECFMASTSTSPVLRASIPFWSSLTSSATNKRLT